ncbi:MAG: tetratricopeptide repeat protein, partial [Stellaceae bacterium]
MAEPDLDSLIARGLAEQGAGRHQAALRLLQQAARRDGASAALYCAMGRAHEALQNFGEADAAYVAAIEREPDSGEAYLRASDLARRAGALARRAGQVEIARELRRASCQYLIALGARRGASGAWTEAEAAFRKAQAIEPELWSAHAELGRALYQLYRHREAEEAIRTAIRLAPHEPAAHYQLGAVRLRQGRTSEAASAFEAALALDPAYAPARTAFADALRLEGQSEAAEAAYRAAAAADPEAGRGLYLLGPIYDGAVPEQILERHRAWGDAAIAAARTVAAKTAPFRNTPDPERRLRVGYVSPDYRQHSVAYFLEPLLAHHDPRAVEIFCYAEVNRPDAATERFRALAHHWRSTIGVDDAEFRR